MYICGSRCLAKKIDTLEVIKQNRCFFTLYILSAFVESF